MEQALQDERIPIADPENGAGVERNVVALGWVAFFGGLAQDMIQPILPLFYASVLGLNSDFRGGSWPNVAA